MDNLTKFNNPVKIELAKVYCTLFTKTVNTIAMHIDQRQALSAPVQVSFTARERKNAVKEKPKRVGLLGDAGEGVRKGLAGNVQQRLNEHLNLQGIVRRLH